MWFFSYSLPYWDNDVANTDVSKKCIQLPDDHGLISELDSAWKSIYTDSGGTVLSDKLHKHTDGGVLCVKVIVTENEIGGPKLFAFLFVQMPQERYKSTSSTLNQA